MGQGCGIGCYRGYAPPQNRIQETTISVQFVPGMRFLVSDFAVHARTGAGPERYLGYTPAVVDRAAHTACAQVKHRHQVLQHSLLPGLTDSGSDVEGLGVKRLRESRVYRVSGSKG
eukprot:2498023-Rhodomonas_salina.1